MRLTGAARAELPLTAAPHVVELAPVTNMAIGKETPWGVAVPLRERLPGTTSVRVRGQELEEGRWRWRAAPSNRPWGARW
ncbi:hypothetical protein STENM36S_00808 [Streptomyces tendae]